MAIDEIIDNFELLDEWEDRYRYLIELGRTLEPLPKDAHTDANKVRGCASQVWLETTVTQDAQGRPILTFRGDSDAHIVRGLIALTLALYSGRAAQDIVETDATPIFTELGLAQHLTPQRSCRIRHCISRRLLFRRVKAWPIILGAPLTHAQRAARSTRLAREAVMAREALQGDFQHHLARAPRPAALGFDFLQAFEIAAYIGQQTGEVRADGVDRARQAPARVDGDVGNLRASIAAASRSGDRRLPIRRHALENLRLRHIAPKTLACLHQWRREKRRAVAAFAARKPCERAFAVVKEQRRLAFLKGARHDRRVLRAEGLGARNRGHAADIGATFLREMETLRLRDAVPSREALRDGILHRAGGDARANDCNAFARRNDHKRAFFNVARRAARSRFAEGLQ
jgi:cysteine desulfuration protein SufE